MILGSIENNLVLVDQDSSVEVAGIREWTLKNLLARNTEEGYWSGLHRGSLVVVRVLHLMDDG